MRGYLLGLVTAVCVVAFAAPAAAGPWWSGTGLDQPYVAVGDTMVLDGEAFFATVEQAETAEATTYYAYLVRGFDRALLRRAKTQPEPTRWWALTDDAEVVRVGTVKLVDMSYNTGRTRTTIDIPRIEPGRYHLMLCDAGCVKPLGHAVPSPVRVVTEPTVARTAAAVARWEEQLMGFQQRVNIDTEQEVTSLREDLRVAASTAREAVAAAAESQRRLDELAARLAELEQPKPTAPPWGWLAAGLLAVAAAFALGRRGRPTGGGDPDVRDRDDSHWERPAPLMGSKRS